MADGAGRCLPVRAKRLLIQANRCVSRRGGDGGWRKNAPCHHPEMLRVVRLWTR
jgi:hypothetical protein